MGAPTNLSDQGAGELSAAARTHGEPIMRLNQLTRYFLLTGLGFLTAGLFSYVTSILFSATVFLRFQPPFLYAGILLLFAGFGFKFLPSSLGGNPHVYSLNLALSSYWLITVGAIVWVVLLSFFEWSSIVSDPLTGPGWSSPWLTLSIALGPILQCLGAVLITYNCWKTMQNRV
jgi:hypothetical protein